VFHSMIESIMYLGIGFLFAALVAVAVIPSIQHRTVRLTMRRLENSIPQSVEEMQAHNDLLRAEFALSTRRLEIGVEQLRERTANQLAELGRKGDVINRLKDVTNRLKIEREAQNAETFALKTEVESLKDQLASIGKDMKAEFALSTQRLEIGVEQLRERTANQLAELGRKGDVINRLKIERETQDAETFALKTEIKSLKDQLVSIGKQMKEAEFQRYEPGVTSLVPKDWPRAEPERGPTNSVIRNQQIEDNDVMSLALERPTTEEARKSGPARAPRLNRTRNRKGRNENR
jgi:chromosome segregation ATPase